MFDEAVQAEQNAKGSGEKYSRMARGEAPDGLGPDEETFLTSRTSIYMATVSQSGWPYVQHRGGPVGFLKVLDPQTIGFADYRGNRQYVSLGNLRGNACVSLFAMDYPRKARLKLLGTVETVEDDPDLAARLFVEGQGKVERCIRITVDAFDWNCPQFITPRFDTSEIAQLVGPEMSRLETRNAELEAEVAALRAQLKG